MPIEGSLRFVALLSGTGRSDHVRLLSEDTATPCTPPTMMSFTMSPIVPPHCWFGTYAVPSGDTRTCPWSPLHLSVAMFHVGVPCPNVKPPSTLSAQKAVVTSWEQ